MPRSSEGYLWTTTCTVEGLHTDAVILDSISNLRSDYDAIIIGSGFAGLIAARELAKQREAFNILLVEARDRIGGRTWTAKALGEEFEMGGTWVHWNQPFVYTELCRYNLHHNLKSSAGTIAPQKQYYKPSNGIVEEISVQNTEAIIDSVAAQFFVIDGLDSRQLMPYPHDPFREPALWKKYDHLTVRERLDQLKEISKRNRDIFETHINSFGSAPGTDIGFVEALRWFALGGHSLAQVFELAGTYKIGKGGMTTLARSIFEDTHADIILRCVVDTIQQDDSGVTLVSRDGRIIKARTVVCTIPLNCLPDITFDPPLPCLRQEAIRQGHINTGAKIHFKLKATEPGWFATCDGSGSSPFVFAFSDHNGSQGADGTWCIGFGYNGQLTDKKDEKHIIQHFSEDIRPGAHVQAYLTHDWMNDPFARGTWSCWGPAHMSKYLQELQKPHGRIFFASADWANGWRGFVDGAIERGILVAREVTEVLRSDVSQPFQAKL